MGYHIAAELFANPVPFFKGEVDVCIPANLALSSSLLLTFS
jgi:hypothetical protein